MIDRASRALLNNLIARDGRSLLQYTCESFPYTSAATHAALPRLQVIAAEEQAAVAKLNRFLQKNHVTPPLLGAYPLRFTTANFVSLDHMLPALVAEQKRRIAEVEQAIVALPAGDVRSLLFEHLDMNRRHLAALQELVPGQHAPSAA